MKPKDKVEEMHIIRKNIERAIFGIYSGFVWGYSKEGYNFWAKVVKRLEEIKRKARNETKNSRH